MRCLRPAANDIGATPMLRQRHRRDTVLCAMAAEARSRCTGTVIPESCVSREYRGIRHHSGTSFDSQIKRSDDGKRRRPERPAASPGAPQPAATGTRPKSDGKPARRDGAAARNGGQPGSHGHPRQCPQNQSGIATTAMPADQGDGGWRHRRVSPDCAASYRVSGRADRAPGRRRRPWLLRST